MSSSIQTTDDEKRFRETIFHDPSIVWKKKMICTSCGKSVKEAVIYRKEIYVHPVLNVLWCKECEEFYFNGEFSTDEDGFDKYCRWCGNGGKLFFCSFCSTAFCSKCIRRNVSIKLKYIRNDEWKCFVCSTEPVWNLRGLCDAAIRYVNARSGTKSRTSLHHKDTIEPIASTNHPDLKLKRKRLNNDPKPAIHFDKKMKAKFKSVVHDSIKESTTLHRLLARKKTIWKNYFGIDITDLNTGIVDQFGEEFTKFFTDIQTRIDQMKHSVQNELDHLRSLAIDEREVEADLENIADIFMAPETTAKETPENFQSRKSLVSADGDEVSVTDDDIASITDTEAAVETNDESLKLINQSFVNASSGVNLIDSDEENEFYQVYCYDLC